MTKREIAKIPNLTFIEVEFDDEPNEEVLMIENMRNGHNFLHCAYQNGTTDRHIYYDQVVRVVSKLEYPS